VLARRQTRTANNARIKYPTLYLNLSSPHMKDNLRNTMERNPSHSQNAPLPKTHE